MRCDNEAALLVRGRRRGGRFDGFDDGRRLELRFEWRDTTSILLIENDERCDCDDELRAQRITVKVLLMIGESNLFCSIY